MNETTTRPGTVAALGLCLGLGALLAGGPSALAGDPQETPPAKEGSPPAENPPKDGGGEKKDGGGEKAPPDKTAQEQKAEEVKAYLKTYEETLSKMTEPDAISGLTRIKTWYLDPQVPEEQKDAIMKLFANKVIRVRGKEAYLESACKCLGEMGGDSSVGMLKLLVSTSLDQKVPVLKVARAGLMALGKIASPKQPDVKFLTDLVKKSADDVVGDVALALKDYGKAPGAVRKEIFEQVLLKSEGVFSKQNQNDNNAKKQWSQWGTEAMDALKSLSRQNFAKPPEFREWFNNKDKGGGKNPKTWADEPKGEASK